MKVVRIIQVAILVSLVGYFGLIHSTNPTLLHLPFLLPMPPALVLGLALLLGWSVGWVPARLSGWRRMREIRRLERRVAELEQHVPTYDKEPLRPAPVIPDRMPRDEEPIPDRRGG